jgi:CubicO group peptidase (beta-lactamase class C family)
MLVFSLPKALLLPCVFWVSLALADPFDGGHFDGNSAQLLSCVALYDNYTLQKDEDGQTLAYEVTLQMLPDSVLFELQQAELSATRTAATCSGRFEADTYTDRVRVVDVDPQVDGDYFITMNAISDNPVRLQLREDLLTATIPARRFASAALYSRVRNGNALVVARNGHTLFEEYVGDFTAQSPHILGSGTKSFSLALYALGAAAGIWQLDEPVFHTITEWSGDPLREAITIRHLLNLSSGLRDADAYSPRNVPTLDVYDLAINHSTQPFAPGTAFIYGAVNFLVLSAVFERKTGEDTLNYLYDRLLRHLGMKEEHLALWARDSKGKPQMGGGARLDTRTWLNYGQLILQEGKWRGQQILDANIVRLIGGVDNPSYQGYGLTWWRNSDIDGTFNPSIDSIPPDGGIPDGAERIAPDISSDLFLAAGLGRQRLYVIPSMKVVIVRYGMTLGGDFDDNELLSRIVGALQP